MNRTAIEWTDFSANPLKYRTADGRVVWACEKLSPGCKNCYANGLADRYTDRRAGDWNAATMATLTPFLDEAEVHKMLTARTIEGQPVSGSKCFVGDMTDIFGEWVPDQLLDQLFAVFAIRSDVTWQILTKRAARMHAYFTRTIRNEQVANVCGWQHARADVGRALIGQDGSGRACVPRWPLPNVWLGTSCENQEFAAERIPHLLQTPAAVRFISAEPLLGPIDLTRIWWKTEGSGGSALVDVCGGTFSTLGGHGMQGPKLDWAIVGGESGPGARVCAIEWVRAIVQQCQAGGVPTFVKQLGAKPIDHADPSHEFTSFEQWVNKAQSWLGGISGGGVRYKARERVVCLDARGRICARGGDFQRARDEHAFPVRWLYAVNLKSRKGGKPAEWPEDLRIREFPGAVAVVHG